jgi:alcohol dehydrogenase class IV
MVDEAAASLRSAKTVGSVIVAIGGGSAIDLAKGVAVTALLEPAVSVQEFLEGVGTRSVEFALPILAMPTTGGTGSEVTKNGVITCTDPVAKKSLRGECLFPRIALVDPQLCESLPRGLTAQSGMDALTQLIESYISCRATPIARAIALQGIPELFAALQEVATGQISRGTREALAHGALLSGMALANAGLGMAHGVAAALGALHKTSHGLACAMLLPVTVRANRRVCTEAYAEIATAMVAKANGANALADEFVLRIDTLAQDLGIPRRLSEINIIASDLPAIVAASQGNSLRGNPWTISPAELLAILREML